MSPGIGAGVGLPFVHLQRRSSSILDQLFGGGQGMYAVAGLREGSGAWTDQTGGGRHVTLPGGSANPIQLDHDGTDYFFFPGTTGNYLSVPDAGPLDIAGDIDIRWHGRLADYTPSTVQALVGKWGSGSSWVFRLNTDGKLYLFILHTTPSVGTDTFICDVATGVTDDTDTWLRATFDASAATVRFYKSTDGSSWTQLGSDRVGTATNINTGASPVEIMQYNGAFPSTGRFYRAIIKDGIDGTTVLDVNASDADEDSSTFTEASSNAATVTINRSASGYPLMVVQRPWSLGAVDDYLTLTDDALWDIAADEDFTLLVTGVRYTGLGHIAYRGSNSFADGYGMSISTGTTCKYRVDDGPNAAQGTTSVTYSERHTWALRLDRTTDLLTLFEDGSVIGTPVSTASVGAITGGDQPLNILGGSSVGTEFSRMAVCAVAFTKRALTADEITASAVAMLALNGG